MTIPWSSCITTCSRSNRGRSAGRRAPGAVRQGRDPPRRRRCHHRCHRVDGARARWLPPRPSAKEGIQAEVIDTTHGGAARPRDHSQICRQDGSPGAGGSGAAPCDRGRHHCGRCGRARVLIVEGTDCAGHGARHDRALQRAARGVCDSRRGEDCRGRPQIASGPALTRQANYYSALRLAPAGPPPSELRRSIRPDGQISTRRCASPLRGRLRRNCGVQFGRTAKLSTRQSRPSSIATRRARNCAARRPSATR